MNAPNPPLKAAIVPVTAFQQNCTLLWCTETNKGALVDPGGDLPKLREAIRQTGVEIEKMLPTGALTSMLDEPSSGSNSNRYLPRG